MAPIIYKNLTYEIYPWKIYMASLTHNLQLSVMFSKTGWLLISEQCIQGLIVLILFSYFGILSYTEILVSHQKY